MKIAYFSDSRVPSSDASSVHVMKMCNAMSGKGHDVTLVCFRNEHPGSPFEQYGLPPSFKLSWYREIPIAGARRVMRMMYALLNRKSYREAEFFYGRDVYTLAMVASMGKPMMYEAHSPPLSKLQHKFIGRLLTRSNFLQLVVISEPLKVEYQRLFPEFESKKIIVAHDAADPMFVEPPSPRMDWPGRREVCQIGYVGSLHPGKGGEIIDQLAEKMPQFDFHVVGNSPTDRVKLRPLPNLHCHGRIDHKDVAAVLSQFDIVLFPGQDKVILRGGWDIGPWTSPMKIFEYMAARRCIIASQTHATRNLLKHNETAFLVPPTDIRSWQRALVTLAADKDLRNRLAAAALHRWQSTHTWSHRAATVLSTIKNQ